MKRLTIYILIVWGVVLLLAPGRVAAQMKGWELGPWMGAITYFGDLNTDYRLDNLNLAGGLAARYNFNERIAFRLSGNYGEVEAYDAQSRNPFEQIRNLSFQSVIVDGSAQLEFNFLPYDHGIRNHFFSPYLLAGVSFFYYNPTATLDGNVYELRPLGTEGQFKGEEYYILSRAFTYGFGLKLDISYEWSVDFHIGARYARTDYIDDVSTIYPDRSDLIRSRGPIAAALSDRSLAVPGEPVGALGREGRQRGDAGRNDMYVFAGVGLMYYFGDLRCPTYGRRSNR